jgi:hypothetical protein
LNILILLIILLHLLLPKKKEEEMTFIEKYTVRNNSPEEQAFAKKYFEMILNGKSLNESGLSKKDVDIYEEMCRESKEEPEIEKVETRRFQGNQQFQENQQFQGNQKFPGYKEIIVTTLKARQVPASWKRYCQGPKEEE